MDLRAGQNSCDSGYLGSLTRYQNPHLGKGDRKARRDYYSNFGSNYSVGHNVNLGEEAKRLKTAELAAPLPFFMEEDNPILVSL